MNYYPDTCHFHYGTKWSFRTSDMVQRIQNCVSYLSFGILFQNVKVLMCLVDVLII